MKYLAIRGYWASEDEMLRLHKANITKLCALLVLFILSLGLSACCDLRDIAGIPCGQTANGEEKAWYENGKVDPAH